MWPNRLLHTKAGLQQQQQQQQQQQKQQQQQQQTLHKDHIHTCSMKK